MIASDSSPIQFWPEGTPTYNQNLAYRLDHEKFILPWLATTSIKLQFQHETGASLVVRVMNADEEELETLSLVEVAEGIYEVDFTPADYDITDEEIYFEGSEAVDTTRLLLSDGIRIMESVDNATLWTISNTVDDNVGVDYDGLHFQDATTVFNYYIPGRFYFQRGVEAMQNENISTGEIIELGSSVKKQRLLEVDWAPDYFHIKMKKVLKLQYLLHEGVQYKQEEQYLDGEPENFSKRQAKVWLTEQGSIVRNVYNAPDVDLSPSSGLFIVTDLEDDVCAAEAQTLYYLGDFVEGVQLYTDSTLETLIVGNFLREDGSIEIRSIEDGVVGPVIDECGGGEPVSAVVQLGETEEGICSAPTTTIYYEGTLGLGTQLYEDSGLTTPVDVANEFIILPGESPDYRSLVGGVVGGVYDECEGPSPTLQYSLVGSGAFAFALTTWSAIFNHTVGTKTLLLSNANPNRTGLLNDDGSHSVTGKASKTSNGGIALDGGEINFKVNGVTVHTIGFADGSDVSNRSYTFTGLAGDEELTIEIIEG